MSPVASPAWDDQPGCTCGAYWSVIPPPACPIHARPLGWLVIPFYSPYAQPYIPPAFPSTRWIPGTYPSTSTTTVITYTS